MKKRDSFDITVCSARTMTKRLVREREKETNRQTNRGRKWEENHLTVEMKLQRKNMCVIFVYHRALT